MFQARPVQDDWPADVGNHGGVLFQANPLCSLVNFGASDSLGMRFTTPVSLGMDIPRKILQIRYSKTNKGEKKIGVRRRCADVNAGGCGGLLNGSSR